MTESQRHEILAKARVFFRDKIAANHRKNTLKLQNINEFNINPFLNTYIANFAFGDASPENIAKALVYPRVLGTSIATSFGQNIQNFCNVALSSYASLIPGIDIEFIDAIDGRRKYCQTKAGPTTINKDDVPSILGHFQDIRNLARTNQQRDINPSIDCVVGVLYGTRADLTSFYMQIDEHHPVICGHEFWHRLTGDEDFYKELIDAFADVATEIDGRELVEETIRILAEQISSSSNI